MKRLAVIVITLSSALLAQDGTNVNDSQGSPFTGYQKLAYEDGSGNITYLCVAPSKSGNSGTNSNIPTAITVTAATNANPVSFTATAHNVGDYGNLGATVTPIIKITGGTGNWTVINGTWTMTPTSADAFTIPVNSTSLGALTGTLVVTTFSPRHNNPVWSIFHQTVNGSSVFTSQAWGQRPGGAGTTELRGGVTGYSFKCSERSTLAYQ